MEGTGKRVAESFFKHKLGVFGLIVLVILYLLVIFADFIAPYNFSTTHRNFVYAPPRLGFLIKRTNGGGRIFTK